MRQIEIPGFTNDIESTVDNALTISLYGMEGSGKTNFLATMPGPMGVIPMDRKSRASIKKRAEELGRKDIFMPPDDFIRHANPTALTLMKPDEAMKYYGEHFKRIMEASFKLVMHPDIRSTALDGGAQLWDDILFKNYGRNQRIMPRDRGSANQDMIDFLTVMTSKHFAITNKGDTKWLNDKPTNDIESKGFSKIGFHVNVILEMLNNKRYNPNSKVEGFDWQFSATIKHCQIEPDLQIPDEDNVLKDGAISFQSLAYMIFPDEDQDQFAIGG